ncbi:helix-turn-helix domain-containing protein [Kitasatospora sp. NBC_01287]|uniref:ArsR/SmtB family transcription factor n=1 Tax=Kitasatospora sp. NBC_01287 TaxID=2903573 RepID=UPI002255D8E6|nr:helix-turn-helix domain-containing protein [Kitasatospora sp. NBC_01287]MCX4747929.1 helix-turn-helix domain-containing protein [Kitasatospora sp. NBC_01287]
MLESAKERLVNDAATLKVLADPLRLAILGALARHQPRPMTVKELAAELEEPPTKLYRHIKQLEGAELIAVAGTRLVSGIVESRYQVRQSQIQLSPEIFATDSGHRPEGLAAVLAVLDLVRRDAERDFLGDRIDFGSASEEEPGVPGVGGAFRQSTFRLRPEQAVRLRDRLLAVLDEAARAEEEVAVLPEAECVEVKAFTMLYKVRTDAP